MRIQGARAVADSIEWRHKGILLVLFDAFNPNNDAIKQPTIELKYV
jgi:hypothetical protein